MAGQPLVSRELLDLSRYGRLRYGRLDLTRKCTAYHNRAISKSIDKRQPFFAACLCFDRSRHYIIAKLFKILTSLQLYCANHVYSRWFSKHVGRTRRKAKLMITGVNLLFCQTLPISGLSQRSQVSVSLMFLSHLNIICELLLYRITTTWSPFV